MSGAMHTPGPWFVGADGWKPWDGAIEIAGNGGETVAWTPSGSGFEAVDARLIAAAPEMLEALKGFNLKEDWIVSGQANSLTLRVPISVIQAAAAAIAKAEGGAQ